VNPNPQDDHVESKTDAEIHAEIDSIAQLQGDVDRAAKEMPGLGLYDGFKAQDLNTATVAGALSPEEFATAKARVVAGTELSEGELARMAQGGPGQLATLERGPSGALYIRDRNALVPGTALTLGAVERLENAAQNLVAVGNLFAEELVIVNGRPELRIPAPLTQALGKINGILAGPGPVALDRRPNSVEVVNDPGLHERALIEARAREQARTQADPKQLAQSDAYEDAQHAHLQDVAQAFEEGKSQGYDAGKADTVMIYNGAYDDGYGDARRDVRTMSLWALVRFWLNGKGAPMPSQAGKVGGINAESSSYWKNAASVPPLQGLDIYEHREGAQKQD
jgi:hypothetical protein